MSTQFTLDTTIIQQPSFDSQGYSTKLEATSLSLSSDVYNTLNDPNSGIQKIVTASLLDTIPPNQGSQKGQGALGLVISQESIDPQINNIRDTVIASYTTESFSLGSVPEAANSNGYVGSSIFGGLNQFSANGPLFGGFGTLMQFNAYSNDNSVTPSIGTNFATLSIQCMAGTGTAFGGTSNPTTSIEFDGKRDLDTILQLKLQSIYNESNDKIGAISTLRVPIVRGTAPNTYVSGNAGNAGQVLTSGGSSGNLSWTTPSSSDPNTVPLSTPPDSATLAVNNSVKIQNGETGSETNYIELSSDSGNNTIILSGVAGDSGQVLTSGGYGGSLSWTTPSSTPDINTVLLTGNIATDKTLNMRNTGNTNLMVLDQTHMELGTASSVGGAIPYIVLTDTNVLVDPAVIVNESTFNPTYLEFTSRDGATTNIIQYTSKIINIDSNIGSNGDILTSDGDGGMSWASQVGESSRPLELVGSTINTDNITLINTDGSATEYEPNTAYGDALIVYNDVGYVSGVSDGFAECIFQNKSATANSSNIIAICESDGDYMAIGQNSSVTTALYNTLFEIRGAGYSSSTGHQIIGANSSGSADKSVVISYANGTAGLQINPSGAIGIGALPTVVGTEVQLTNGSFGSLGSYLCSNGSSSPPTWKGDGVQVVSTTSGNVTTTIDPLVNRQGTVLISPDAGTTAGRLYYLPIAPPIGFTITVKNCSGVTWNIVSLETDVIVFGSNVGASTGVGIGGTGGKAFFTYIGFNTIAGVNRPVWVV